MEEQRTPLWINRNFGFLWLGQSISAAGNMVLDIALALWIATRLAPGQSWAPLAVSGLMLAVTIPTAALGPLSGVFVDRWDKRVTMLASDGLRTLLVLALLPLLGLLPGLPHLSLGARLASLYGITALATVVALFFDPARMAIIGQAVPGPLQARASSLSQVTGTLAAIVGPALAALLLFQVGLAAVLLLDAFSFLISLLSVWQVHIPLAGRVERHRVHHAYLIELRAGLAFFRRSRVLMTILITASVAMLGVGAMNALDIFFVTQSLHTSASLYGILASSVAVGMVLGSILVGMVAERVGLTRALWSGVLLAGALLILYSRMKFFLPAVAILFLTGIPLAAVNIVIMPLILRVTPPQLVGRVDSVLTPAISLATMLSVLISGALVSTILHGWHASLLGLSFGPVDTVFTAAGALAMISGVYAFLSLHGYQLPVASAEAEAELSAALP